MTVLVIGSIALDSLETPFGAAEDVLGGSGSYFSLAASALTQVQLVGVVGSDLDERHIETLRAHGVDLQGLQRVENGKTFRWKGRYEYDMSTAQTLDTQLNVFGDFQPNLPESYRQTEYVYLANITPSVQLGVLDQVHGRGRAAELEPVLGNTGEQPARERGVNDAGTCRCASGPAAARRDRDSQHQRRKLSGATHELSFLLFKLAS